MILPTSLVCVARTWRCACVGDSRKPPRSRRDLAPEASGRRDELGGGGRGGRCRRRGEPRPEMRTRPATSKRRRSGEPQHRRVGREDRGGLGPRPRRADQGTEADEEYDTDEADETKKRRRLRKTPTARREQPVRERGRRRRPRDCYGCPFVTVYGACPTRPHQNPAPGR